jgi:hypothetical protein
VKRGLSPYSSMEEQWVYILQAPDWRAIPGQVRVGASAGAFAQLECMPLGAPFESSIISRPQGAQDY